MLFSERIFSKEHPIGFRGSVIIENNILSSEPPGAVIHKCSRTFEMVGNFMRYIFVEFEKIFRTSIFLTTSEGLPLNIPGTRSLLL